MMLQRRALFGGKSGWDDPDEFSATSLWVDLREKEAPFTLPLILQVFIADTVTVDWGDGSQIDTTSFATTGYKSTSHVYNSPGFYILKIEGVENSYIPGVDYGWVNFFANEESSSSAPYANIVKRARLGKSLRSWNYGCLGFISNCDSIKASIGVKKTGALNNVSVRDWIDLRSNSYSLIWNNLSSRNTITKVRCGNCGSQIFDGSTSIQYTELTDNITNGWIFRNSTLKYVVLTPTYTSLSTGGSIFEGCISIKGFIIQNTDGVLPVSNSNTTGMLSSNGRIYVHNSLLSAYQSSSYWTNFSDRFIGVDDFTEIVDQARLETGADKWEAPEWPTT